ncbi:hypothetical protein SINU_10880 [Sporolactobacillus inulinus CASD]|uniref:Uncharacterized protein n=1 Tax=Sporolactobacillus inulinus CASD TaxID=1069536 RepID=A0A0U1QM87_9BACL|nr:hypothetical protein SINU_10880 [Sporolactobacillus inulinus CASD]
MLIIKKQIKADFPFFLKNGKSAFSHNLKKYNPDDDLLQIRIMLFTVAIRNGRCPVRPIWRSVAALKQIGCGIAADTGHRETRFLIGGKRQGWNTHARGRPRAGDPTLDRTPREAFERISSQSGR